MAVYHPLYHLTDRGSVEDRIHAGCRRLGHPVGQVPVDVQR